MDVGNERHRCLMQDLGCSRPDSRPFSSNNAAIPATDNVAARMKTGRLGTRFCNPPESASVCPRSCLRTN